MIDCDVKSEKVDMTDILVFIAACLIVSTKAEGSLDNQDCVPAHWRTIAIGLIAVVVVGGIITAAKYCLPRCVNVEGACSINEEISIISSKELMSVGGIHNGKKSISSNIEGGFGKRDSKQLTLDMTEAQTGQEKSPSISFEPATPSSPGAAQPASPLSTEWVDSNPPPPPPETHLWVPSTARRRSVSLRGDSDDEKEEKPLCSYCGGSLYQSQSASESPFGSMALERKRSVTFNQNVEEIHVLSNDPKKTRSRSPSLLLSGPFYAR